MKISYLSTAEIPSRKANSVHIMKMCAAFAKNGHEVTLYAPSINNSDKSNIDIFNYYGVDETFCVKRVFYPSFVFGHYFYAFFVLINLLFSRVDLIFSRNLLSLTFASLLNINKILEIHQPIPITSRLQNRLFRILISLKYFKRLVVITKPLKSIFLSKYDISEDKILVAPDGADIPSDLNMILPSSLKRIQVGYVGHLYSGRGIELIIELSKICDWADFFIVGGNDSDIKRIKTACKNIRNISVVGFLSPSKAEIFRLGMDVLLAPYQTKVGLENSKITTEAWMSPLKIFEYMAATKSIICSDIPVLHEVLRHNENCLLCKPTDLKEWKEALESLNDNKLLRERLSKQAYSDLINKYTWQIRASEILK
tara:strand:+ start:11678 stop:12784 length:1107 start_codon:yes stop_codon:yes gene_type:complete